MVVGLPSSSSSSPAAALIQPPPRHEEAQAADGAARLPQLLQQEAQIGQQGRAARRHSAQRGSGHHADAQRAAGTGEAERRHPGVLAVTSLGFCLKYEVKL